MRLFVAVELDDAAVAAAARTADALRAATKRTIVARWVPAANMHLTVRFIGHIADERADAVLAALTPPLPIAPFHIELGRCGVFPATRAPRVIWIGLAEGLASLEALHQEFDWRLAPLGFEPEQRAFSAHLTVARVKDVRSGSAAEVRERVRRIPPPAVRWRVERATIFQSRLSPGGARYEPLGHAAMEKH